MNHRLHGVGLFVGLSTLLAYACTADGVEEGGTVDAGSDLGAAKVPTETPPPADKDAGKKKDSSSIKDAGKPDTGSEGDPCYPGPTAEQQPCGRCGYQERVCIATDSGVTGGVWSAWGKCDHEVNTADACTPGMTYPDIACGNCGTAKQTCMLDCHFADPFCVEPTFAGGVAACHPTDVEFKLGSNCAGVNEGREHTCQADCQWGGFGACKLPPTNPNTITISATAGKSVTKKITLLAKDSLSAPFYGPCPTTLDATFPLVSNYIEVKNTTAKTAVVSAWHSNVAGGTVFYTVMAAYSSPYAHVLLDDAFREQCVGEVNDFCATPPCGNDFLGGLVLGDSAAITIPAGKSVTIYSGSDETANTDVTLNVKTESLK